MKQKLFYVLAFVGAACLTFGFLCGFTGCIAPNPSGVAQAAPDPQVVQLVAQTIITNTVPAVLNKNPAYEAALVALADGADLVLGRSTLSPEDVNAYLDFVANKTGLDPQTRVLLGGAILDLYNLYTKTAGVQPGTAISTADPRFVAYLAAFKDSIREGIRRYHVFSPNVPTASVPVALSLPIQVPTVAAK